MPGWNPGDLGEVVSRNDESLILRVPRGETALLTSRILAELPVKDLTVEDPPLEDAIEQVFALTEEPDGPA